jgi:hypothetical protein
VVPALELPPLQENPVVVRASHVTGPAPDALVMIDQNEPVLALVGGAARTNLLTGGILTMVAEDRYELFPHIGIFPGNLIQNLGVHNSWRGPILGFAGNGASLAPHTTLKVDHHS